MPKKMTGHSRDSPLLCMTLLLLNMATLSGAFPSPNNLSFLSTSTSTTSYSTSSYPLPTLHSSLQETETSNAMNAYTTTTPTTNKKKRKKKRKKHAPISFQQPLRGPGRALSQEELVDHVTQRQSKGDEKVANRGIFNQAEQAQCLKRLNSRPALVLNADYQPLHLLPLSLWSWQEAVKAIFSGKVTVVDVYPDVTIRAANLEIPLPSVIALNEYVPLSHKSPAFTRRNVFLRDEYKCQYCRQRFHTNDLSLDHVVPRCKGGALSWTNAVTCCVKCNGRKGSMPVSQLRSIGMELHREPHVPSHFDLAKRAARMVPRRVDPSWKPFLGFPPEDEEGGRTPVGQDEEYASYSEES